MKEVFYGLSYSSVTPHSRARRRRHVVWGDLTSKCGVALVEPTSDLSLPLCGGCRIAMTRLQRERGKHCPGWG